jgi:2-phospho-L-lactate guanylyltransferase
VIVIAVPVKDLVLAKHRLRALLGPARRQALMRTMLHDVLVQLTRVPDVHVRVVTRDPAVRAVARAFPGVEIEPEGPRRGHTAAVRRAQRRAAREGARLFLTLPADVPCLTVAEVVRVIRLAARLGSPGRPAAVFVPSRSGRGTNAAALVPPDALRLRFGEPSLQRHLARARAAGVRARVLRLPGLALDIDEPADLAAAAARRPATATARLLARWGLAPQRLPARPA